MKNEIIEIKGETKEENKMVMHEAMSPDDAKAMMGRYQAYVDSLLDPSDYQLIKKTKFKKKSAWRKLAMASELSVRIVDERREELPSGDFAYHFVCEATNLNGRVTSGSGSCTAYEKAILNNGEWQILKTDWNTKQKTWETATPNTLHNVRSTAETRAWNRAVSNMIAAGEVSADEILPENTNYVPGYGSVQSPQKQKTVPSSSPSPKTGGACEDCSKDISEAEKSYSGKNFNKALCMTCQNKYK